MTSEKSRSEQASILVLGKVIAMVASSLTPFLIVRILGKGEYGALSSLLLLYTTVSVFLTAGIPPAVLYFLADKPPETRHATSRRLLVLMFGLGCTLGVLLFALGLFGEPIVDSVSTTLAQWFPSDPSKETSRTPLRYLVLFALYPVLDLPVHIVPNILIAEQKPRWAAGVGVVQGIAMSCGTLIPAALSQGNLWWIIVGLLVFKAAHLAFCIHAVRHAYNGVGLSQVLDSTKHILKFSLPLGLTDIINKLHTTMDQYIILFLMGAVALAEYKTGAWQVPLVPIVAYSVGAVYLPEFVRLFNQNTPLQALDIWRQSIQKVSLIVIPIASVFIVSAEEFVTIAFTEEYARAAPVFRFYCILILGRVASFGGVLVSAGRSDLIPRAAAVALISNIVFSIPLAFIMGFNGPALGTVLAFIPTVAAYCWYISKAVGVHWNQTFPLIAWSKVLLVCAIPSSLSWALKVYYLDSFHPSIGLTIQTLIILIGFALLGTLTRQITRDDWTFVWNWLRLKVLSSS